MAENKGPQGDDNKVSLSNTVLGNHHALNGGYDFDIKQILKRAYGLSAENNWTLVLALACVWAVTFAIYLLYIDAFGISDISKLVIQETPLTQTQEVMIKLTLTFFLAPMWTGIAMLSISCNRKVPLVAFSIFQYFRILPALALASICIDILFTLGVSLFFIPGFYVFVATTFTLPLIADKKMRPLSAITSSIKMCNLYLWKMLQLYFLFLIMLFVVFISVGFAYLWIAPLYFNVKAILYQDLFCGSQVAQDNGTTPKEEGLFNA